MHDLFSFFFQCIFNDQYKLHFFAMTDLSRLNPCIMYAYCMRQNHPWLSCLYMMWANSNGLTIPYGLHQGNQPTIEASGGTAQDALPCGSKQHGRCCFPYGSFEAPQRLLTTNRTQLKHYRPVCGNRVHRCPTSCHSPYCAGLC